MVSLKLILEMDLNRIDDLQERVIGVSHVSMIPVRRGLLYSDADISFASVNVAEGTYSIWFIRSSSHYIYVCMYVSRDLTRSDMPIVRCMTCYYS